jgi:acetolactate synthase II small subunit
MLNQTIAITANNQPTVLERLFQVTRFRGFTITGCTVFSRQNDAILDIELTLQNSMDGNSTTESSMGNLFNQLNKLFDIKQVNYKSKLPMQQLAH